VHGNPTNWVMSSAAIRSFVPMPIVLPYMVAIVMTVLMPSLNSQKAIRYLTSSGKRRTLRNVRYSRPNPLAAYPAADRRTTAFGRCGPAWRKIGSENRNHHAATDRKHR